MAKASKGGGTYKGSGRQSKRFQNGSGVHNGGPRHGGHTNRRKNGGAVSKAVYGPPRGNAKGKGGRW